MSNVVDFRTRLSHGHLANRGHDIAHHARMLATAVEDLRRAAEELNGLGKRVAADLRALG